MSQEDRLFNRIQFYHFLLTFERRAPAELAEARRNVDTPADRVRVER
jgi:hypothetical protein